MNGSELYRNHEWHVRTTTRYTQNGFHIKWTKRGVSSPVLFHNGEILIADHIMHWGINAKRVQEHPGNLTAFMKDRCLCLNKKKVLMVFGRNGYV